MEWVSGNRAEPLSVSTSVETMAANPLHCEYAGITERILGAAFEVHSHIGPGLLESTYRACLARQLTQTGLAIRQEVPIPISYKDLCIEASYRADLIVEDSVLIELKALERILPIHEAQTLTYLKHSGLKVALLLNFNVLRMKQGVRRFVR